MTRVNLDGGGEEPRASCGFFWPIEGFLAGAFELVPIPMLAEVEECILEFNW